MMRDITRESVVRTCSSGIVDTLLGKSDADILREAADKYPNLINQTVGAFGEMLGKEHPELDSETITSITALHTMDVIFILQMLEASE